MLSKQEKEKRQEAMVLIMDDIIPEDHLLKQIDKHVDFDFIYELVKDKYCLDNGRPSIDPVILIKIQLIQCLFGIKSMRQTIKDIEVNIAYRWFLGLGIKEKVPHFSTVGKNYERRFKGTNLYEEIFSTVLERCIETGKVDKSIIFIDSTHVKAAANNKKFVNEEVKNTAKYYEESLKKEINEDREEHNKKPLKEKDDNNDKGTHNIKKSTTDPESGWFHKGEHKNVFAYNVETACDKNGFVLGSTVHPGNEHDSTTFMSIYNKVKDEDTKMIVVDAGYKTPAIAKTLIDDNIDPLFPYKRPMTKKGYLRKKEYVYDELLDVYICPELKLLKYSTTDRNGYRLYKSNPKDCINCKNLEVCTNNKHKQKTIIRHIWEDYIEQTEDIRHTLGNKEIYAMRKETIERIFGTIKEHHGFRYTLMKGKAKMEMKSLITFTCINMKKLVKILARNTSDIFDFLVIPIKIIKYLFTNKKLGYIYIF